ncbi:hypothetical protein [Pantoea sp. 18069]|uniref:hypothetical protein n=1 Tax=Pantoea sp. 18069 TaxID=2681415 RepID=UPI0013574484|nr:hypothetical protein [Pantoea sp. 18069]
MRTIEEIKGRCFITEDGHWLWKGALRPDGRPNIHAPDYTRGDGGMQTQCGTRAVWHCANQKPVPPGYRVIGTCSEKACCNPRHVACVSESEFGERLRKTGAYKGKTTRILANRAIGRKRSVFTPERIAYIQASTKTGIELAAELGISKSSISKARRGQLVVFAGGAAAGMFQGLMQRGAA